MVHSKDRQLFRPTGRCRKVLARFCLMVQSTLVIFAVMTASLPLQAVAQDVLSREDALQADLVEAIQMLDADQLEMLLYDFMPEEFTKQMRQQSIRFYGRNSPQPPQQMLLPKPMANQLTSQLKAAQSGKITWNRDKSLAWIQFTTEPIEVVPAEKPGYVPETSSSTDSVSGLGAQVDEVLAKAIELLESKRFDEFALGMLPIEQANALRNQEAMDRWVNRLKQHPKMVDAMIRDLKAAQAGRVWESSSRDSVGIENKSAGIELQLKKVAGSWRLSGMNPDQQMEYKKFANAEIAASIIPAQNGTLVLKYTEGRWRLMAMPTRLPSAQDYPARR